MSGAERHVLSEEGSALPAGEIIARYGEKPTGQFSDVAFVIRTPRVIKVAKSSCKFGPIQFSFSDRLGLGIAIFTKAVLDKLQ